MKSWYSLALRLARQSLHPQFKMAAVAVRGGQVISWATNREVRYQHAEKRMARLGDLRGATVFVARVGDRMSRPCPSCLATLKMLQVARIVYTNWDRKLVMESL